MSKTYYLHLPLELLLPAQDLSKHGRMKISFDLMDILPAAQMKEILEHTLEKKGWKLVDGVWETSTPMGNQLKLDPNAKNIEIDVGNCLAKEITLSTYDPRDGGGLKLSKNASAGDLDSLGLPTAQKETLIDLLSRQTEVAKNLLIDEALKTKLELNKILKEAYREAITQKAGTMGNITSVAESSNDGTYRIRVEIQ